jgi:hypothetical protein
MRIRIGATLGVITVLLVLFAAGADRADAAVRTWNNPAGGFWSEGNNWLPVGAPIEGDDLVFPSTQGTVTTYDDLPLIGIRSVTYNGDYQQNGAQLTLLSGGLFKTAFATVTLNLIVVVGANQTWTMGQNGTLNVPALILSNNATWTLDGPSGSVQVNDLSGTGSVVKDGNFSLYLPGANLFFGPMTLNAGNIYAGINAFGYNDGTAANATTVNAPARVHFTGFFGQIVSIPEAFFLNGNGSVVIVDDTLTIAFFFNAPITPAQHVRLLLDLRLGGDARVATDRGSGRPPHRSSDPFYPARRIGRHVLVAELLGHRARHADGLG